MNTQPFNNSDGIVANIMARQAYSHTISLLFGFVEDPMQEKVPEHFIASAGLLEFDGAVCAVTCYHVLKAFCSKRRADVRFKFQIGSFVCDPWDRLRDYDEVLDVAILDVGDISLERLSTRNDNSIQALKSIRWPTAPVQCGDFVILCGFPLGMREMRKIERKIGSIAFPVIERVTDVDQDSFVVNFRRDEWVAIPTDVPVPEEIRKADINGLSGSPVFSGMRNVFGNIGVMEFVGTVLSEIPFEHDGVRVRSSRCISAKGKIVRSKT